MVNKLSNNQTTNFLQHRGLFSKLWNKRSIFASLFLPVLLAACNQEPIATAPGGEEALEEVAEEPREYIGKKVTVAGEVEEVVGPRAFVIQDDDIFGGEEVLVVSTADIASPVEDSEVQVTGTVRLVSVTELEREFELGPGTEYEVYVENKPVIVSDAILVVKQ